MDTIYSAWTSRRTSWSRIRLRSAWIIREIQRGGTPAVESTGICDLPLRTRYTFRSTERSSRRGMLLVDLRRSTWLFKSTIEGSMLGRSKLALPFICSTPAREELEPGRVAGFPVRTVEVPSGAKQAVEASITIRNPSLWGPPPTQTPHLYVAITQLKCSRRKTVNTYETRFGIRSVTFSPDEGVFVNGERVRIQGVNQHHDLGALGTAFNLRAAQRQLEIPRDGVQRGAHGA